MQKSTPPNAKATYGYCKGRWVLCKRSTKDPDYDPKNRASVSCPCPASEALNTLSLFLPLSPCPCILCTMTLGPRNPRCPQTLIHTNKRGGVGREAGLTSSLSIVSKHVYISQHQTTTELPSWKAGGGSRQCESKSQAGSLALGLGRGGP